MQPDMTESNILQSLCNQVQKTGNLADAFPWLVEHNVPRFILSQLWPELLKTLPQFQIHENQQPLLSFAASEPNWKGRIENIKSKLVADTPDDEASQLAFIFNKSYIMQADQVLFLARFRSDFALLLLPFRSLQSPTVQLKQRDEPSTIFKTNTGTIHHYSATGTLHFESPLLPSIQPIKATAYSRVGIQVIGRELSGLALLAVAKARHHEYRSIESNKGLFEDAYASILKVRSTARLRRPDIELSKQIIDTFAQSEIATHGLWQHFATNLNFLSKANRKSAE